MTTDEVGIRARIGWKAWLLACALAGAAFLVYWPVVQSGFVAYIDPVYVTGNSMVRSGLSWNGLIAAFSSTVGGFWQPLTILSHMLDCGFWGLKPAAHHAVNLFLHLANILLLFGILARMTGSIWRTAFVAALFALHPMNVESVAWVADRGILLCAFFWFLATWAYVGYTSRPSFWRYLAAASLTFCAMMSHPLAVTLPFALFLLDYWPLKRMSFPSLGKLFLEKAPLVILSFVFSLLTLKTQSAVGAIVSGPAYSLIDRLSYAVVNYVLYIDKTIWPSGLAVLYPMWTTPVSLRALLICLVLLVFVTVALLRRCIRFPYLMFGWLWYLGAMLPMVGIVLVGYYSMADRFVYVPLIGIFMMVSWGVADFVEETPRFRRLAVVLALLVLLALGWTTRMQVGCWRDSASLFRHAVEVTSGNYVMHEHLGRELATAGKPDEAISQFAQAVRINNSYLPARANLARLLFGQGRRVEAFALQSESISLFPHDAQLLCDAGTMLADAGRKGQASISLMQALWLEPDLAEAHFRLALLLLDAGKMEDAYPHLVATVQKRPDSALARRLLDQVTEALKKAKQ